MKTRDAVVIVLRAALSNANGHDNAIEILRAVHIVDGEVLKRSRCDHKFVDSKHCLKCGWEPDDAISHEAQQQWDSAPKELKEL